MSVNASGAIRTKHTGHAVCQMLTAHLQVEVEAREIPSQAVVMKDFAEVLLSLRVRPIPASHMTLSRFISELVACVHLDILTA